MRPGGHSRTGRESGTRPGGTVFPVRRFGVPRGEGEVFGGQARLAATQRVGAGVVRIVLVRLVSVARAVVAIMGAVVPVARAVIPVIGAVISLAGSVVPVAGTWCAVAACLTGVAGNRRNRPEGLRGW